MGHSSQEEEMTGQPASIASIRAMGQGTPPARQLVTGMPSHMTNVCVLTLVFLQYSFSSLEERLF
jgi:hypothetical protein